MACTTLLVGKNASYDGSTMIARNDDSGSGHFTAKKFVVVQPEEHPAVYRSVLSHVEIPLPGDPMRMTAMPNAVEGKGIWAAAGVNAANVGMTATETITSNPRVLGADPLVVYQPARGEQPEVPGGIGEEDIVYLVLPYIHTAREGVERLGKLLETYGTYEMNGIAFQDVNEIWWLETIGGHHWMARRVPDDSYVVMPNQLGIDAFDLDDAFGAQENHLCSADLREFIAKYHLDLAQDGVFDPRAAFGSHTDSDHVYNTPRAWYMLRTLNPTTWVWDGPDADYTPASDDLPWCMVPEKKITPEDVKYVLSSHYQGTPYDPYASYGARENRGVYRSIGINRNDFVALIQLRPDLPADLQAVEWVAYASNALNAMVPFYANVETTPAYLAGTTGEVSTDSFYWVSRMIAAMADASYGKSVFHVERYELGVLSACRALLNQYDAKQLAETDPARRADPACIDGQVTFDHVKFGYTPEKTVIHNFSCNVKPGQKVAIVGPTGAGKTTMVKLLMRFYDVDSGEILLNGHNVRDFDRSDLREGFGMVLQDTWLFKGTIMENIRYGRLDATDEEVIAAAKAANADHFIRTLPGGYQMELNEDASNVSQGQKQLLTIARTILADNRILILDEATSSVDTRTEQRIQTAMDRLMQGRTSFVIAHRLSTIRDADLILVMREGDIVEQGTHDELIEAGGFYADLYNSQFEDVTA